MGKYGVQIPLNLNELFFPLFADDIVLLSITPGGLQMQINNLKKSADRLCGTFLLEKNGNMETLKSKL